MRRTPLRVLAALIAFIAFPTMLGGCAGLDASLAGQPAIDIAILTVLEPEYAAAAARVEDSSPAEGREAQRYRFLRGEIESEAYDRPYQVVVGMTGDKGEVAGALATRATIARWNPRYVMLVGIAGGVGGSTSVGDVVLPETIWAYERGHLAAAFTPKITPQYRPDPALLRAARAVGPGWTDRIRAQAPRPISAPRVLVGPVASGDKVIETKGSAMYSDLLRAVPDMVAVEMEGAGAAAAVIDATDAGYDVGFMMVRAVSDVIVARPEQAVIEAEPYVDPQRKRWRDYASEVAAAFAEALIRDHWPAPPR